MFSHKNKKKHLKKKKKHIIKISTLQLQLLWSTLFGYQSSSDFPFTTQINHEPKLLLCLILCDIRAVSSKAHENV